MLSALVLAVSLYAAVPQDPPTIQQVRQGMFDDMRKLKSYSDEWRMIAKGQDSSVSFTRHIDGKRNQMAVIVDGKVAMESGYDGKNTWMTLPGARVYSDEVFEGKEDKPLLAPPAEAEEGTLSFAFSGAYDFQMWSKPDVKVTALETVKLNDKDVRKVTATAKRDTGSALLEMWFDTDRWRLLKARFFGGKTGEELDVTMEMVKSSFDEKYDANSFVLEQAKVSGFDKKPFEELKKLVGG